MTRPHLTVVNDRAIRRAALTRFERDRRLDDIRRRGITRDAGVALIIAAILLAVFFSQVACTSRQARPTHSGTAAGGGAYSPLSLFQRSAGRHFAEDI